MQTGSSETFIGWKSGKTTYVPLWDRMEGAWLWTQLRRGCVVSIPGRICPPVLKSYCGFQLPSFPTDYDTLPSNRHYEYGKKAVRNRPN
jgi:hypothetical protein